MMGEKGKQLYQTVFAEVLEALKKEVPQVSNIAEGEF
jgi:hypothetical protein